MSESERASESVVCVRVCVCVCVCCLRELCAGELVLDMWRERRHIGSLAMGVGACFPHLLVAVVDQSRQRGQRLPGLQGPGGAGGAFRRGLPGLRDPRVRAPEPLLTPQHARTRIHT